MSQMGGQTFFTVLGCYLMGRVPLTGWMVLAMTVVVAGVVFSCIPLFDEGAGVPPSLQVQRPPRSQDRALLAPHCESPARNVRAANRA